MTITSRAAELVTCGPSRTSPSRSMPAWHRASSAACAAGYVDAQDTRRLLCSDGGHDVGLQRLQDAARDGEREPSGGGELLLALQQRRRHRPALGLPHVPHLLL